MGFEFQPGHGTKIHCHNNALHIVCGVTNQKINILSLITLWLDQCMYVCGWLNQFNKAYICMYKLVCMYDVCGQDYHLIKNTGLADILVESVCFF